MLINKRLTLHTGRAGGPRDPQGGLQVAQLPKELHSCPWHHAVFFYIKLLLNRASTSAGQLSMKDLMGSVSIDKDVVVVGRDSPVFAVIVLLGEVFLVVGEEGVELDALFEVLDSLNAPDVLEEIEVAVGVDASSDQAVPVNALKLHIRIVLLERKVQCFSEVNVWTLDGVHVLARHLELVEVEVLWKDFHCLDKIYNSNLLLYSKLEY